MLSVRSHRSLTLATAILAGVAEAAIAWAERLPFWLICPMAIATSGIVIFAALGLDALTRRARRPDRQDIDAVRALQRHNAELLDAHDARIAHAETRLFRLATDRDLADAERDLAVAAEHLETWDALARDLPRWDAAVERWSAIVARIGADLAPDIGPPSDAELRSARAKLPPARNFSSQELKGAVGYFVQRERIVAAHERLQDYRNALDEQVLQVA